MACFDYWVGLGCDCDSGRLKLTYHSLYCSFHCATQPSGTLGIGGAEGAMKSAMIDYRYFSMSGSKVVVCGIGKLERDG